MFDFYDKNNVVWDSITWPGVKQGEDLDKSTGKGP